MGSTLSSSATRITPSMPPPGKSLAAFANGCFWGTEHLYRKHFGNKLDKIVVGYTGGKISNPSYRQVCSGNTGHAESIQITFDPSVVSYESLVDFFFRMHDPTTLNAQGNDRGTQYRSAIFTYSPEQKEIAHTILDEVQEKHFKGKKIVTEIVDATEFYEAEDYHQEYLTNNPSGYVKTFIKSLQAHNSIVLPTIFVGEETWSVE